MSGNLLTLGCDPELIPVRKKGWIPAWELTKGTKAKPDFVAHPQNTIGLKIQADGVALEFNIDPVAINGLDDCRNKWPSIIDYARRIIEDVYSVNLQAHPVVSLDYYASKDTFKHPMCQASGCDPDFDAYADRPMRAPLDFAAIPKYRFTGGHIHVGYDKNMCPPEIMARFMDLFVGLEFRDPQNLRRRFYGQAGIFRPKEYGLEYRTLSPSWVMGQQVTYNIARGVLSLVHGLTNYPEELRKLYRETNWPAVKHAIEAEDGGARRNQLELRNAFFGRNCPESFEFSPAVDAEPRAELALRMPDEPPDREPDEPEEVFDHWDDPPEPDEPNEEENQ